MTNRNLVPSFLGGVPAARDSGILARLTAAAQEWNMRRRTAQMLGGLNDRLLDDIGLTRADLDDYRAGRGLR